MAPIHSKIAAEIIDIRGTVVGSNTVSDLREEILSKFSAKTTEFTDYRLQRKGIQAPTVNLRSIPTMVLYSDKGLEIYDKITYNPEYYLTNCEINIFENYAADIVANIRNGDCLIELGCGAMRKTKYVLEAITRKNLNVTYYAVDLSEASLRDALAPLVAAFPAIRFVGLWGTYNDSLEWSKNHLQASRKTFLWLGSSIGNLNRHEAAQFMAHVRETAMDAGDLFVCGVDRRNSFEDISLAYNDTQNITRDFIMSGLDHCNTILGSQSFDESKFEYVSIYNAILGRHEAYYESKEDQSISILGKSFSVSKGEMINVEYSYKYSADEITGLLQHAKLYNVGKWTDSTGRYDLHLFQKPPFYMGNRAQKEEHYPSLDDFEQIWLAWDSITGSMIEPNRMEAKPIHLRHPYIFYMGHLPAFLDIQLAKCLNEPHTNPEFSRIFERGIDPDTEDPTVCHPHSEVPETWPLISEVQEYTRIVRERVRTVYKSNISKRLARVLFMTYDHECMHLETLLYMMVQDKEHAMPSFAKPILKDMSGIDVPENVWVKSQGGNCEMGLHDPEAADFLHTSPGPIGWDNEKGKHTVTVKPFEIQHRPVTIREYHEFLMLEKKEELLPKSWAMEGDSIHVLTVFGQIPIKFCWHWPVYVSGNQAKAYATHKGMDLPTEAQLKLLLKTNPSTANDNHSFSSLCPRDVQPPSGKITDLVGNGWDWTQTIFAPHPNFEQSELYPGYSSDFLYIN